MNIKEYILKSIIKFPNSVNRILLKANVFPKLVYGKSCLEYTNNFIIYDFRHDYLINKLFKVANHSIQSVPFYKKKSNFHEVLTLEDFKDNFGFIDKDIVMNDFDSFVQADIDRSFYIKGTTGGTSGKPMQLLMPKDRYIRELGAVHALWGMYGFNYDVRAVLRNHKVENGYTINPITKEFIFNGFDLTDRNFETMYLVMKKNNIKYLQCYPSSGYEFAMYLKNNNLDVSFIKAFFVSSENILEHQRSLVKSIGINYFSLYGHSEKLIMSANCPHSDYYHIIPDYGYFELVDENGEVITEEGVIGEMVGSTISNYGFPLLRYKTGDFSEYINIDCECGYKGKALKTIYGRWSGDRIYNKDGTFVTTTSLNLHNDLYSVIDGLQYVQNKKGVLIINIIPGEYFNKVHEKRIYEHYKSKFNNDADIVVLLVDALKRQDNGKFLLLLSSIT